MKPHALELGFLALLFSPGLCAQELVWERIGPKGYSIGWGVWPAGDIDGDGYEDLFTGVMALKNPAARNEVWLLSGRDGRTLRVVNSETWYLVPVNPIGVGDMDGDGVPDYAVTFRDASWRRLDQVVEVRSGRTGALLWKVSGPWASSFGFPGARGSAVIGDLDLDGDKKPDLVVAAMHVRAKPLPFYIGEVHAFANGGKRLYTLRGNLKGQWIGLSLAKLGGDLDRDGRDDYIVGTNGYPPNGYGQAMVVSGATGKTLVTGIDPSTNDNIGLAVTGTGDVDGDGILDFAAAGGASYSYSFLRVFSGKDGRMLRKMFARGLSSGISSRGLDFDRDGVADFVRGAPNLRAKGWNVGSVFVFSGRDGTVLYRVNADFRTVGSSDMAYDVLALPPPPGSSFPLFAFDQMGFGSQPLGSLGRVAVYRGRPAGVETFGRACRGRRAPRPEPRIGVRSVGAGGTRVHLSSALPGSPAALLVGGSRTRLGSYRLPLALDRLGFPGCSLLVSSDLVLVTATGTSGDRRGYARIDLPLPLRNPGTLPLYGQWFTLGPGPGQWGFSEGLLWRH